MKNNERGYIERLIACGFTEANAVALYMGYMEHSDAEGLEKFVRSTELIFDDRSEYPNEL